ncbi:hypothetical protein SAMN02744133_11515 [Thalassospira xiamenensis M-5 = DSM 17429]|nr:hypothetical protein SAMN02744133_11515 [Thalassospira xiamenensis M-5 = DSM 17429]
MTSRSMIFTAGTMTKTSGQPPADDQCGGRTQNPRPDVPPPGSPGSPRASPNLTDGRSSGSRPAPITPGHHDSSGNRWSPDTSRASTILASRQPRTHRTLRSLPATATLPATDGSLTHFGRLPSSPTDDLRAHRPLPSPPAIKAFPATDEARTHLGRLLSSFSDGLRAHYPLRSLSATTALSANRRGPDTLRAHGPHWSTIDGSQIATTRCCHRCRSRQI